MTESSPRRGSRRLNLAVITATLLVLALVVTLGYRSLVLSGTDPLADAGIIPATAGDLTLGISATGQVEPRRQAELAFALSGRVAEVLVDEGDFVAAGTSLLRLDDRQLVAAHAAAAANLARAEADLLAAREGATPEELAEAAAQVRAAQGNLAQAQGSNISNAELAAARAAIEEARANLAQVEAGPRSNDLTRVTSNLEEARAELERQRSALSSAKENARQLVETRANAVRNAQSVYSSAHWDLQHVLANETDPRSGRGLNSFEQQDYQVAYDRAALALADAEAALAQADKDYATARQNEVSGLQSAEARVATADAEVDRLRAGADADVLAAARARLARAEADLARLTSGERAGAVAAQAANVEAARARLAQLGTDPSASSIARAEANVAQAEAQLAQAQIQIDDATLVAPFDGIVATINVAPGEQVANQAPVTLIDVSRFIVRVTVDEVDIARVSPGQPVDVLIDALNTTLPGTVQRLEALPQTDSAVTAYLVAIEIDPGAVELKPGMTASATIIAARREDVVRIPANAVQTEADQTFVNVVVTNAAGERSIEQRLVVLGLRANGSVEVIEGLAADEEIVLP